jgi:Bcr/CflA subfamily drug resistance transporter
LLGGALCQFFYGPLSDIFGRKRTIVTGYAIFTVGSILCFCAPNIMWLLVGRIIQGMGIACTGLFRSVMRDFYRGSDLAKIASIVAIAASMTPPLAPITGGYLEHYFGWRSSFVLLFIMGITSIVLFSLYFPESLSKEKRHPFSFKGIIKKYIECFSHRNFVIFSACSGLCLGLLFAYMTVGTFLYQHVLGLSPIEYGWLSIFGVCFMPLGAYLNRAYMEKYSIHQLTVFAAWIMMAGSVLLLILALCHVLSVAAVLVPTFIIYIGIGFIFPNSFTQAFEDFGHIAGVAGAAFGAIQIFTSSILSALAAQLPATSQLSLGIFFVAISATLLCILKWVKS